jgi:hypothetical protein
MFFEIKARNTKNYQQRIATSGLVKDTQIATFPVLVQTANKTPETLGTYW